MSEAIALEKEIESTLGESENIDMTISTRRNIGWKLFNAIRYVLPYPRKIINYIGVRSALITSNANHRYYPFKLGIEASSKCNLKCPLCPRTSDTSRPTGNMDFDSYTKLIDKMAPYLFQVRFHSLGEPTLHPRLPEMVAYAHRKRMYTNFHTNGHFLTEKLIHELINAGLDEINIALDGLTEEVYRKYRIGGSSEKVKEGIIRFCKIKRECHSKSPRVNLQFLVMSHNEHEIPALREFAAEAGVDWVFLKTVNIMHGKNSGDISYLPSELKYSRYRSKGDKIELSDHKSCTRTFSEIIINWDGTISLCACDDPQSGKIKGNIFTDGIQNILFGQDMIEARRQSLQMSYEMCNYCIDAQSPV